MRGRSDFATEPPTLAGMELRRASRSFQQGISARIGERLETMHAEREASIGAARSSGTALIIMRHRLVEDAFRNTKVQLQSSGRMTLRRNAAYRAGQAAGDRVNLGRPIDSGSPARLPQ
jgi:hypothetical protein